MLTSEAERREARRRRILENADSRINAIFQSDCSSKTTSPTNVSAIVLNNRSESREEAPSATEENISASLSQSDIVQRAAVSATSNKSPFDLRILRGSLFLILGVALRLYGSQYPEFNAFRIFVAFEFAIATFVSIAYSTDIIPPDGASLPELLKSLCFSNIGIVASVWSFVNTGFTDFITMFISFCIIDRLMFVFSN